MIIKWQSDGKVQVDRKQNNMATIGAVVMEARRINQGSRSLCTADYITCRELPS